MDISPYAELPIVEDVDPVQSVPSVWAGLVDGLAAPYSPPINLSAGWGSLARPGPEFRLLGKLGQWIQFTVTRTGADITTNATGNVDPNVKIGDLIEADDHPDSGQFGIPAQRSTGASFTVSVNASGEILLTSGYPGATIPTGGSLRVQGLYIKK